MWPTPLWTHRCMRIHTHGVQAGLLGLSERRHTQTLFFLPFSWEKNVWLKVVVSKHFLFKPQSPLSDFCFKVPLQCSSLKLSSCAELQINPELKEQQCIQNPVKWAYMSGFQGWQMYTYTEHSLLWLVSWTCWHWSVILFFLQTRHSGLGTSRFPYQCQSVELISFIFVVPDHWGLKSICISFIHSYNDKLFRHYTVYQSLFLTSLQERALRYDRNVTANNLSCNLQ